MPKLTIDDLQLGGKKVFIRVDFNVPLNKKLEITDDNRIVQALPTIKKALEQNAKVILASHFARPEGQVVPEMSLKPVAVRLSELLNRPVKLAPDCIGPEVEKMVTEMQNGEVVLLENLRFHKAETKGDEEFARKLASLADVFINDAFGAAHRAHASVSVLTKFFKQAAAGYLMEKEIRFIGGVVENPQKPLVAILGGAKVSDKIKVIENLLEKADKIIIGGAMMFTFLRAQGKKTGNSLVEEDRLELANELLSKAKAKGVQFLLPVDTVVAREFKNDAEHKVVSVNEIEDGWMGLDIGPATVKLYAEALTGVKTVVWNGPMGVFEMENFAQGTIGVCQAIAGLKNAITIIGGGDSAAAAEQLGYADKFSHVSTGGGASLEFLEGKELPGVTSITDK